MEQLNKQQIILLALLVSFVSSIASGIVTVSLMQQDSNAPVTQTINRVVERTIERVSSDSAQTSGVKETVIVREDQAVVNAIAAASKAIVRVFSTRPGTTDEFVGIGVILDSAGKIAARLGQGGQGDLVARLDGGNSVSLSTVSYDSATGVSVLAAEQSSKLYDARTYAAAKLADPDDASLGQAIVVIGGGTTPRIASGIITAKEGKYIETSVADRAFDAQAVLVNLLGEVLGIKDLTVPDRSFLASDYIGTL